VHGLFLTWTQNLVIQRSYITVFTHQVRFVPLAPCYPLFYLLPLVPCYPLFYLLGEPAFLLMVRIPIHSCPWFVINCPPFAASPTLPHPVDQVTIFTETTSTTSAILIWHKYLLLFDTARYSPTSLHSIYHYFTLNSIPNCLHCTVSTTVLHSRLHSILLCTVFPTALHSRILAFISRTSSINTIYTQYIGAFKGTMSPI
jgi:hypothetical protein